MFKFKCPHCNRFIELDDSDVAAGLGSLGGKAFKKTYGKEAFSVLGKLGMKKRWEKVRAAKQAALSSQRSPSDNTQDQDENKKQ